MGQIAPRAKSAAPQDVARALEELLPQDILGLAKGRQRYALFTNEIGGIVDDLMVANFGDHLFLVVNAPARMPTKLISAPASDVCVIEPLADRALLALEGPMLNRSWQNIRGSAQDALHGSGATEDRRIDCFVSRSGCTGEDGYEISVPAEQAEQLARLLLQNVRHCYWAWCARHP